MSAAVQSAGVPQRVSADSNVVRNIPVNSDAYLVKAQHNVPADEKFFYRLLISFFITNYNAVFSLKVYKLVYIGYVLLKKHPLANGNEWGTFHHVHTNSFGLSCEDAKDQNDWRLRVKGEAG